MQHDKKLKMVGKAQLPLEYITVDYLTLEPYKHSHLILQI